MAVIKIKNLKLKTIIGILDPERVKKQDIVINIKIKFDETKAVLSENIADTVNYKELEDRIREKVEASSFLLLEKLVHYVLDLVMEDKRICKAVVKIDKIEAMDYSESVSVKCSRKRKHHSF